MNSYATKTWTWGPETLAPAKPACICAEHHAAGTVAYCFSCKTWTDADAPEPEPERKPARLAVCCDCKLPEVPAHLGGCDCDPFAPLREVA